MVRFDAGKVLLVCHGLGLAEYGLVLLGCEILYNRTIVKVLVHKQC